MAAGALGAAAAAVVVIGLRVDALVAAFGTLSAGALAIGAGQIAVARLVATPAVLLVVVGIDAEGATEDLVAGTAAILALPNDTGDIVAAAQAAASAVQGVGLGVDARLAALDGAVLALLRLLLATLLLGERCRSVPTQERGQRRSTQEVCQAAPAQAGRGESPCEVIKAARVHRVLLRDPAVAVTGGEDRRAAASRERRWRTPGG
jgi:hypothetical protein